MEKKALQPAIEEIESWDGLREFRNHVLAHNLRNKKLKLSVFEYGLDAYNIPQFPAEIAVFQECIRMIKRTFESAFKEKLQTMQKAIDQRNGPIIENRYKTKNEANAATGRITNEINANLRKKNQAMTFL